jgi:hypothetical protein
MNALERTLAVVLPPIAAAGIVWASSVPLTLNDTSAAVLRLAWAVRPERIETCRDLGPEELVNVPQHMRQARICEGTPAEYRLIVRDASGVRLDRTVRGGGLRQDRRLYVFEELSLATGASLIDVRFERVTHPASGNDESRDGDEDTHDEDGDGNEDDQGGEEADDDRDARQQGAVPPRLTLVTSVTARPRDVVLVTYDETRRALVAVQPSRPPGRNLRE